jgi:hypothetical protein
LGVSFFWYAAAAKSPIDQDQSQGAGDEEETARGNSGGHIPTSQPPPGTSVATLTFFMLQLPSLSMLQLGKGPTSFFTVLSCFFPFHT